MTLSMTERIVVSDTRPLSAGAKLTYLRLAEASPIALTIPEICASVGLSYCNTSVLLRTLVSRGLAVSSQNGRHLVYAAAPTTEGTNVSE